MKATSAIRAAQHIHDKHGWPATITDPILGTIWLYWYRAELRHGPKRGKRAQPRIAGFVCDRCEHAVPRDADGLLAVYWRHERPMCVKCAARVA